MGRFERSIKSVLKALLMTMKPQSFLLSAISASAGTALASLNGPVHWGYYLLTVLGVVLLHGGSNVINDYFDYRQRVDISEVPGSYGNEARVLIQKMLQPSQVLWVALILFALSLIVGIYITAVRGWPVFLLGFVGFLTGLLYTARPVALKYVALGEPAVFFMFGPLIVTGSYYVQRGEFSFQSVWVSFPLGILVALILLANNIRDIQFDSRVGIHTLATLLRKSGAVRLFESLVAVIYGTTVLLVLSGLLRFWSLLTLLSLPLAIKLIRMLQKETPDDADARTAQLDTAYGCLLILAILLERFV
jgi:1,4-dihydroxy-2-naphthoate polyprenyltransferase